MRTRRSAGRCSRGNRGCRRHRVAELTPSHSRGRRGRLARKRRARAMISVFELFKIGVGPSSSHTVGPMRAAAAFAAGLPTERVAAVRATLLGSLAFTGKGHATDRAVILGLAGQKPDTLDATQVDEVLRAAHVDRKSV